MISSQSHLILEFRKVNEAIGKRNSSLLKKYHREYINQLRVPKTDVFHENNITIYSSNVSYHLLSLYFLLDVIEYFWDGKRVYERPFNKDMFLFKELNLTEMKEASSIDDLKSSISKVSNTVSSKLFVFLLPYSFSKNYALQIAFPGNVLILYHNDQKSFTDNFFEGVGEFYLKSKLRNKLPRWADSEEEFIREFLYWCQNKHSRFN